MSTLRDVYEALQRLKTTLGDRALGVKLGPWEIVIEGVDDGLSRLLALRWGGFVTTPGGEPGVRVRLLDLPAGIALGGWGDAATYTLEAESDRHGLAVRSHHFAVTADRRETNTWLAGIERTGHETAERIVDNVMRYLVCRLAVEEGGLALHAAGVLRDDRAYVLAGPSGAGKTTAMALSSPCTSLGDDFAVVLPDGASWKTFALPFDNSERAPSDPPAGYFPVAGVWRLYHSESARVETPRAVEAVASLMGCAAFPWAMPDLADRVLDSAGRFVADSVFGHLHFRKEPDFWKLIERVG